MIRRLSDYLGENRKYVFYCVFLVTGEVVSELLMPLLMAKIIDVGIPANDIGYIARIGLLMTVLGVIAIGFGIGNMRFSAYGSQGFAANLRQALFEKVLSFSFSNIDSFNSASLITRLTNDITQLQITLMMSLRMLLRAPLMLFFAVVIVLSINAHLSIIMFVALPLLAISLFLVMRSAERLFMALQQRLDALNQTIQENLIAIRVVKAFVREAHEKVKFKASNDALMNAAMRAGYLVSLMFPIMMLILSAATIAVIWFGGRMVAAGEMGTGELISFLSYLMMILFSAMMFTMVFILFARAKASAQRVLEVLDTQTAIVDPPSLAAEASEPIITRGGIEFRHVDFRYATGEGDNALSDIDFSVTPGELVAIVGGTGSGKSTLLNLVPRLYDVAAGQVLIDGTDVRDYRLETLRAAIGMVLQQNVLFSGTIRENLLWGNKDASQEEIERCAMAAQIHDFIIGSPEGYETMLGQGGVNVSGGQRQRLCIARAMLKRPRILILDDSTSAVDTATEARIRRSFQREFKHTTVLLVSQRISSVKDADTIIVLDDGRISGIGTHEALVSTNAIYREICLSQQERLAV